MRPSELRTDRTISIEFYGLRELALSGAVAFPTRSLLRRCPSVGAAATARLNEPIQVPTPPDWPVQESNSLNRGSQAFASHRLTTSKRLPRNFSIRFFSENAAWDGGFSAIRTSKNADANLVDCSVQRGQGTRSTSIRQYRFFVPIKSPHADAERSPSDMRRRHLLSQRCNRHRPLRFEGKAGAFTEAVSY